MKPLTYPEFCTTFSKNWPFIFAKDHLSLYSCYFNQEEFKDTDYASSHILLPPHLESAVRKRKAEYLAGRICAKLALEALNCNAYPATNLNKSPIWPDNICGSITHSKQLAAAIVGSTQKWQSIGLDIEQKLDEERSKKLLNTVLNCKEQQLFNSITDIGLFTTMAFSVKESLFKALYPVTLKRFYFKQAEIIGWSLTKQEIYLRLLTDLSTDWQTGREIIGHFCEKDDYIWTLVTIAV